MRHPLTTTLSLLLFAYRYVKDEDLEHRTSDVLTHLIDLADWTDEKKADLYAMIVESVSPGDSLIAFSSKVNHCLLKSEEHFRG